MVQSNSPIISELNSRLELCKLEGVPRVRQSGFDCVSLLYGTNRGPKQDSDSFYGNAPLPIGSPTVLGEVVVTIPQDHQAGDDIRGASGPVENSEISYRSTFYAIWGGENGPKELTREEFRLFVKHKLDGNLNPAKTALVFVHGFNVSFESAAYNTAQLKTDLNLDGPVFFFSWPSNGKTSHYIHDQQDADLSAENLANFLKLVKSAVGEDTSLNIVGHSMGHRVIGQAFNLIRTSGSHTEPIFDLGVFASADLDENLFEKWIIGSQSSPPIVKRSILYVTDDDRALVASKELLFDDCDYQDPKYRVGLVTKKDCVGGERRVSVFGSSSETIDLSTEPGEKILGIFGKNHNKYTKSPKVICHMLRLLDGGKVARSTEGDIVQRVENNGQRYWSANSNRSINWGEDCRKESTHNLQAQF